MNLFSWSIPFVSEKVTEVLHHIIKPGEMAKDEGDMPLELMNKKKLIEAILVNQRDEAEKNMGLIDLSGSCPDERLIETGKIKEAAKENFYGKRKIDLKNESRPSNF